MESVTVVEPPRVRAQRPTERHLSPVPAVAGRRARGPFIAVLTAILGVGLLTLLALNTALAQGAFVAFDLKAENARLADREQDLLQQVAAAESPESLEAQARDLGMVPAENPVFLRLADGKVLGVPVPAVAPVVAKPPAAKPAPQPSPVATKSATTAPSSTAGANKAATNKAATKKAVTKKAPAKKGTRP